MFDDLLADNARYAETFALADVRPQAARGLGLVTCIDSRIEPLTMLGLVPGDAKILRNAGGRVSEDVLRSLILAVNLLEVQRIAVMHHTRCAMESTQTDLVAAVSEAAGADASAWDFTPIEDPAIAMQQDVDAIRSCPLIPDRVAVVGWRYDTRTGRVEQVL